MAKSFASAQPTKGAPLPDDDVLVRVENVSKKFCRSLKRSLWYGLQDLTGALNPFGRRAAEDGVATAQPVLRSGEFWAVRDVSFELRRGECLGLIGHNGAGKSTLLKVLNGLIPPDTGRITMRGRVAALIELNAGFNPILTGRENIFNQAALLGFSRQEILEKFDDIVEFSEVGEFLDMPVQNYSSGMRVRLGFAVAAQMEPDVLIIDEVLAVGDVGFRAKCLARMGELLQKAAFIFVSHSMPQIARICTSVLHLDRGNVLLHTSTVSKGLDSYYASYSAQPFRISGSGKVTIRSMEGVTGGGTASMGGQLPVVAGEPVELRLECEFSPGCEAAVMQYVLWNQELNPVMDIVQTDFRRCGIRPGADGRCCITTVVEGLTLNSGRYSLSIHVLSPDFMDTLVQVDQAMELMVKSLHGSACPLLWPSRWAVRTQ